MKKTTKFLMGLLEGVGASGNIFSPPVFSRPVGDDESRMRGDVQKVGKTMEAVIRRESAKSADRGSAKHSTHA